MTAKVSVVILTCNRKDDLLRAVYSIYRQAYDLVEVVLVDNASTDGSREAVLSAYPDVKYIRLPHNLGVIGGRNVGIANADGDLVLLLDDDAELLSTDALKRTADRFAAEPELAVVFFRYTLVDGEPWGWTMPYAPESTWVDREIYTDTFVGCAHCIRREWIDRIGPLKSAFFREGEEQDFAYKVYARGGRVLYFPDVCVLHRLNPNQRVHAEHQAYKLAHRTENDLIFLGWADALVTLMWRLGYSLYLSLVDGWLHGYVLGCWHLLKAVPRILRERRPLDAETMNLIRTLRSYVVMDLDEAREKRSTLRGYIRVRVSSQPLGVIGFTELEC